MSGAFKARAFEAELIRVNAEGEEIVYTALLDKEVVRPKKNSIVFCPPLLKYILLVILSLQQLYCLSFRNMLQLCLTVTYA